MTEDQATDTMRAALTSLRSKLLRDLESVRGLRAIDDEAEEFDELSGDLDRQLERARSAAVVCLVGSTGAGKSTLLNALVGRDVAIEGIDRPTTSAPVIYRPADADVSELVAGLPGQPPTVVSYDATRARELSGAAAFWRGQILVDAPDVNSVETLHRDVVKALASRADVLVVVAHRQSVAELSSATFVDLFAERRGMVFVLGRADELSGDSRGDLLAQLRSLRDERWKSPDSPVLAISAREGKSNPDAGGLAELRAELESLISSEKLGSVRRRNAIGNVARISGRIEALGAALDPDIDALQRGLESGANQWCGAITSAVHERLDVRKADLVQMLWNDAAKVWDGPGGYALKVGGLSALGLGAGAAVARRNPVLAAGLAVGSVAADRMRDAVRGRHFESTSGLLPGASDVVGIQRDAFLEARLAAESLYTDPEQRAMTPSEVELDGHAARAVDEAWDRILRVDLPREARRGVPRALRWLVDLPVYAIGVWVLVRVVIGFIDGAYVGIDFLVSAVIIALAWLFGARLLVRARLSAKSARLLQGVREDVEQRVGAAASAAIDGRVQALGRTRDALGRLRGADRAWRERLFGAGGG